MIPILLRQLAPRILLVAALAYGFYLFEPGFHQHGPLPADALPLPPTGLSFTLANLAGLAMIVLLGGFISVDRRRGFARLFFSHPTRPVAFYGVRWGLALAISMLAATVFLYGGQWAAWGELRVGARFLLHAFLFAGVYGGLLAFFSVALPRGDAAATGVVYLLTEIWHWTVLQLGADPFTPALRQLIFFVLPPHLALSDVYEGLTCGEVAWGAALYAGGYGLIFLLAAGLLLRVREWA